MALKTEATMLMMMLVFVEPVVLKFYIVGNVLEISGKSISLTLHF